MSGADWWRGGAIYQIYPRSFFDANNDGIGDIAGITAKLDYVAKLGVDAVWISPFFPSPMQDFGYDVSEYCGIAPEYGTMEDFDALIARADELGVKIMIDMVMSHTSDQHPWFKESRFSRDNPKSDWYIWADPKPDGTPPNNWLSIFGGSAWEWDTKRRQYYMHNFLTSQPDLNFHNPDVRKAILEVVEFWLIRGVKGFRLDTVNFYFHDQQLRDNPINDGPLLDYVHESNPYNFQKHIYNKTQPECLAFLEEFRALLGRYKDCASVGEMSAQDSESLVAPYTENGKRLHMVYTFSLLTDCFNLHHIRRVVEHLEERIQNGWVCWAFSNHDVRRVATRWRQEGVSDEALTYFVTALFMALRGSFCLYQGEELSLPEADIPYEKLQDPYGIRFWPEYKGRDGCRTPIPWDSSRPNAGFSTTEPWLPVPDAHSVRAVDVREGEEDSILHRMRELLHWRKEHAPLTLGNIHFLELPEPILGIERKYEGKKIVALFNFSTHEVTAILSGYKKITPLEGLRFECLLNEEKVTMQEYSAFFAEVE